MSEYNFKVLGGVQVGEGLRTSSLQGIELMHYPLQPDRFQDIGLNQMREYLRLTRADGSLQWLTFTPPALVQAHLNLDNETMSQLSKVKPYLPSSHRTQTCRTPRWPTTSLWFEVWIGQHSGKASCARCKTRNWHRLKWVVVTIN